MVTHANDNDELSFTHIAALTANVVRYLEKNTPNQGDDSAKQDGDRTEKEDAKGQRDYVAERVAAIERFERVARGEDRLRRKRREF